MITERTLKKWRREALFSLSTDPGQSESMKELLNRILRMTQELIDQHLLR